jgi:hypothetical protein
MRSLIREGFVFRHFFDGLALGGALAEWGLVCWLLDLEVPVGFHIVVPALLGVVNRLAARRFEREPVTGLLTGRAGYVTLAIAFGALVSAGGLAVLASAWVAGSLLGAVNRGLGTSGQRVRVGVPREISVLTLTAACRRGRARSRGAACRRRSHIFASST